MPSTPSAPLRTSAGAELMPAEGGTVAVAVSYLDTAGAAVTPTAVTWTLTTAAGTAVNSRSDVSVATPGTSNTIVLTGADLPAGRLRLLVEWTYNSTIGGTAYTGLTGRQELTFTVVDLAGA